MSQAQTEALQYIRVDQRLSHSLPARGQYFTDDPDAGKYTHPSVPGRPGQISPSASGFARIYDSGNIVIYELADP